MYNIFRKTLRILCGEILGRGIECNSADSATESLTTVDERLNHWTLTFLLSCIALTRLYNLLD